MRHEKKICIPLLVQKSTEVANAIRYEASTFIVAYLQLLTDIFQKKLQLGFTPFASFREHGV